MTYDEMAEDVFRIPVPLPDTPLKETNSYLVRGRDRDLLIDTGFNHPMCLEAMRNAWTDLGVRPERTDLFVTHMHADHSGLIRRLAGPDSRVYMSEPDSWVAVDGQNPAHWRPLHSFIAWSGLIANGFPMDVDSHPGFSMSPDPGADLTAVRDGDELAVGRYRFTVLATPGHTAGHVCLYEPERRILFSGDHILGRITPNITLVAPGRDVLADYLASLDRLAALPPFRVFPGHRQTIADGHARIGELKDHHARRLAEVERILAGRRLDTVGVTREMRWSLSYRDWDDYPPAQKLFSTGEAFAHLYHLVEAGRVRMIPGEIAMFESA